MSSDAGFHYDGSDGCCSNAYLLPRLTKLLQSLPWSQSSRRIFDLGCGNGAVAHQLHQAGYEVTGVDPSADGIRFANEAYPQLRLEVGSAYDDLQARYGQFPMVISLEVIEHVYAPRHFVRTLKELMLPGGYAIISTPYHGYWKNLALALTGKMDSHFTALWDHGHIKFWSFASLTRLLEEAGLKVVHRDRVGRLPMLAKSMIFTVQRTGA